MVLQNTVKMLVATAMVATLPMAAQAFEKIVSREKFVEVVEGKDLKLMGITVTVTPDGGIKGRAFGAPVSGQWQWRGGFFCRSLFWGERDLGPNCQEVRVEGDKIRFTSDKGSGQYAVLNIR